MEAHLLPPTPRPPESEPVTPQLPPNAAIPNDVPVHIHLLNGKEFIVDDVMAWAYTEQGVFATGHFKGYSGDLDILIPYERVDYYELRFDRLKRYHEDLAAKVTPATEETPDDDPSPSA